MRIKKDFILFFLPVIAVLCFIFPPAFADMKSLDEEEMARMNASVTGASANKQVAVAEKGVDNPETWQASETLNKGDVAFSRNNRESITLDINVKGSPTHQFYYGGSTSNMTGGITSVTPR